MRTVLMMLTLLAVLSPRATAQQMVDPQNILWSGSMPITDSPQTNELAFYRGLSAGDHLLLTPETPVPLTFRVLRTPLPDGVNEQVTVFMISTSDVIANAQRRYAATLSPNVPSPSPQTQKGQPLKLNWRQSLSNKLQMMGGNYVYLRDPQTGQGRFLPRNGVGIIQY